MAWTGATGRLLPPDLNRLKWHVRTLVSFAEKAMIDLLQQYNIRAYAKP